MNKVQRNLYFLCSSEACNPLLYPQVLEEQPNFIREDPSWPNKEILRSELMGEACGIHTDSSGKVFVFHRGSNVWDERSFDFKNIFQNQTQVSFPRFFFSLLLFTFQTASSLVAHYTIQNRGTHRLRRECKGASCMGAGERVLTHVNIRTEQSCAPLRSAFEVKLRLRIAECPAEPHRQEC